MRKIVLLASLAVSTLVFSQITLSKTFLDNEEVLPYKDGNNQYYVSIKKGSNVITIYNQDYSVYKTVNTQIPTNYDLRFVSTESWPFFTVSRYLFNTDNKIEIFVYGSYYNTSTSSAMYSSKIINEDGVIVKDFGNVGIFGFTPYTDPVTNKNKMLLDEGLYSGTTYINRVEIYTLPTSSLTTREIAENGNRLTAFPVPTSNILNVINPKNGFHVVEITDVSGKIVKTQNFGNEDRIVLQLSGLPKGLYFYKVGGQSGKFIKE